MRKFRLLSLTNGVSKAGNPYSRISLRSKTERGSVISEFFIPAEVGHRLTLAGAVEDVDVIVRVELNEFLKPSIFDVQPVSEEGGDDDEIDISCIAE